MDIFNRLPSISEDTLHYALYPPLQSSDKASVTSLAACLYEYIDALLPNFIWHRDGFELKAAEDPDDKSWSLEGHMRVGDCVDDEWCVVWLLREISSKWDLVISIYDNDGEFLLIEAAEELPSWVKPRNAENRVWIYKSRLHLIPVSHVSPAPRKRHRRKYANHDDDEGDDDLGQEEDYLAVDDAVKLVRDQFTDSFAPAKVETTILKRISGYPGALREHVHTTNAYIPADVAKALLANPSLVQKSVETFYTRDAIQLRAAYRMSRFPPSTNILRSVKLTRTAYAQLVGQRFFPPKIFGQWRESEGSKEYKWKDIGMKIAVGFEMLYQESKSRSSTENVAVRESKAEADKDALRRSSEYRQFIEKLVSAGYFKGEKTGSQLWNQLENNATNAFVEIRSSSGNRRLSFAKQAESAISKAASIGDPGLQEEDDDSWLSLDVEEFENKLARSTGGGDQANAMDVDTPEISEEDRVASEQTARLKDLANKVEEFVEGEGDLEGVRIEDEEFSEEDLNDESEDMDDDEEQPQIPPFDHTNRSATTKEAMDKLVPGLSPAEYGKMPASYYRNSQRVAPTTMATDVVEESSAKNGPTTKSPETRMKPIREPIFPRDRYDGVDSDDETDEEDEDEESEEDNPQVVGEVEIDMREEEDEFLEFSRQVLGISDEHWNKIIEDRKGNGDYVPKSARKTKKEEKQPQPKPSFEETSSPQSGPQPNVDPDLNSFKALMDAMDAELSRQTSTKREQSLPQKAGNDDQGKGKEKFHVVTEGEDIEAAMEAELKAALEREDDGSDEEKEPMDYNLIKNFLESFKSQAGLPGPVSNLAGRLQPEFKLPRDGSD